MADGVTGSGTTALLTALSGYGPRGDREAVDLRRIRDLLAAGDPWERHSPVHLTAGSLIVHPPTRRVLLRWHARQQAWLHVGGHADPGETDPLAIALRESREETGLTDLVPWPDAVVRHLAVVPVAPTPSEAAHEHADIRYFFATARPQDARPEKPGASLRWLPVAEAIAEVPEANLREMLRRAERLMN